MKQARTAAISALFATPIFCTSADAEVQSVVEYAMKYQETIISGYRDASPSGETSLLNHIVADERQLDEARDLAKKLAFPLSREVLTRIDRARVEYLLTKGQDGEAIAYRLESAGDRDRHTLSGALAFAFGSGRLSREIIERAVEEIGQSVAQSLPR
jgi:hypothetical protein